jgi:hypothetical protein
MTWRWSNNILWLCIHIMCRDTTIIIINFNLLTFYSLFHYHFMHCVNITYFWIMISSTLPLLFFLIGLFVTPLLTHVRIVLALHFFPLNLMFFTLLACYFSFAFISFDTNNSLYFLCVHSLLHHHIM